MEPSAATTEQRQLLVEIQAVTTNIDAQQDAGKSAYEVEQGRKLIEKAVSLGLPEASFAKLKDLLAAHDAQSGD